MRRLAQIASVLVATAGVCAGQVVDRIVATVNRQPILLSDWEVEMRYEALVDQKPLPVSDDTAHAALDRLIDQELLKQQMKAYRLTETDAAQVNDRLRDLRHQLPNGDKDAGYKALLERYGLSEAELRERVEMQLTILRFIDVRLRPSVHVDRRSIEAYYNEKLLPEVRKKGDMPLPLADVASQIEELLSQQKVDTLTNEWLKDLRQQSEIRVEGIAAPQPSASAKAPQGKQ